MSRLVAAPDKFRGTASAPQVSAAIARAARASSWDADEVPLSDGGEGLLDAVGGSTQHQVVSGPLGEAVEARWQLVPTSDGTTGVIEMAQAAGRDLLVSPVGTQPIDATTAGVGQLIVAALDHHVRRIIVGCGGSATTDGGWGCVEAVGDRRRLEGVDLVAATDVTTCFRDAAKVFGPQKGASPEQITALTRRLDHLAQRYRTEFDCDVDPLPGSGAAGGLAGGLAALGGRIVGGFNLVADLVELDGRLESADLVVTGEGKLDAPSFRGKVVGSVIERVGGRCPVLCVVGRVDPDTPALADRTVTVVSLVERYGEDRALHDTTALVQDVVAEYLGH